MFGKGLDGCGVQRGSVEMQNWCIKNKIEFDTFDMIERVFVRAKGHKMPKEPIKFKPEEMDAIAKKLEEYDVVILNSFPSWSHEPKTAIDFYNKIICKLEKPILVGMMHEIRQTNMDCYPFLIPILNRCDIVYNFSEKTWFAKTIGDILPSKKAGDRTRRFKLWMDLTSLREKYRDKVTLDQKDRRMLYVGRWSTMKDPARLYDLWALQKVRTDERVKLGSLGIEKSVGARVDILDKPGCLYTVYFDKPGYNEGRPGVLNWEQDHGVRHYETFQGKYGWERDGVPTFGPYDREVGMREIAESLFACSFYRLPKDPENYGDRMEYTQIEIIGCGTIPVFDAHFGHHNFAADGKRYDEVDHLAIWSDKEDLMDTLDQLSYVADHRAEQEAYRESSYEFIKNEFDADKVLPKMFYQILKLGKDPNKYKSDEELIENVLTPEYVKPYKKLIADGIAPSLGFKQAEERRLSKFVNKARVPVDPDPGESRLMSFF